MTQKSEKRRAVYFFGGGEADGDASMRQLLGGKGANLAEMTLLGIPVPPGFTLSTAVCDDYQRKGKLKPRVYADALTALARIEGLVGRRFGDPEAPLLVSVRSGAPQSMPGMMDTVLNLGLNDQTVAGLAELSDARFAWDSYRRFVQMYGDVVLGVERRLFEDEIARVKKERGKRLDTDLTAADWQQIVGVFQKIIARDTRHPFPQDPHEQLWGAVNAVFGSWMNPRAHEFREMADIPEVPGTAVNVQAMVFGNLGPGSATGVAFTRGRSGEPEFWGEYLINAQGEDVVAGIRTPAPLNKASRTPNTRGVRTLEARMPSPYRALVRIQKRLEGHYRDMQDIEFTIENGRLWILQTRNASRTGEAAVRVAVDMVREGRISRAEAIMRVEPSQLDQLLHPTFDPAIDCHVIARGMGASPGAAVGRVVFSAEQAATLADLGEPVLLVRTETSPDDLAGMRRAEGILTKEGGLTSHAAVVARGAGMCCVVGCAALEIDEVRGRLRIGERVIRERDFISIDGSSGEVMLGQVSTVTARPGREYDELMSWADRFRRLKVRANADTPEDARVAVAFGAEGIGLCRTEHMFFEPGRIAVVRRMILAQSDAQRADALDDMLPMQRADFIELFETMQGRPVTVRLLDAPLHEFLPKTDAEVRETAKDLGLSLARLQRELVSMEEHNPMLGHRGCRLAVTWPEIYAMQVRAIAEAALALAADGVKVMPEIMIPLIATETELAMLRREAEVTIKGVKKQFRGVRLRFPIGTMIEVPRAALTADSIAEHADFFSFGTNDLTQTGYALSRDDAGRFLPEYIERGLIKDNPFATIDEQGIGRLVVLGTELGRQTKPSLEVGVCGEHGGDPASVVFFARTGLDYVSCSPYRIPIARLAAAQAEILSA